MPRAWSSAPVTSTTVEAVGTMTGPTDALSLASISMSQRRDLSACTARSMARMHFCLLHGGGTG
jgi:hypothetical protein